MKQIDTSAVNGLLTEVNSFIEDSKKAIEEAEKAVSGESAAVKAVPDNKPVSAASIIPTAALQDKRVLIGLGTAGTLAAGYGIYKAVNSKKKR